MNVQLKKLKRRARLYLAITLATFLSPSVLAQNLQFDSNVSAKLRQQVLDDLGWLASVDGLKASPLHSEIFGPIHGGGYSQWFHKRVYYFGVDRCGGGAAVACVKSKYKNKIFVTGNYINGSAPQVGRLMTLYHEARHTEFENGMWSHAKCPRNFPVRSIWTGRSLANKTACDSTEYGSYASASILMNNISKFCSTNCTDKIRADAKIYSDDQVRRVIGDAAARIKADFAY